jgi:hypothetical protein
MNILMLRNLARYYKNPSPMTREEIGKELAASYPPEAVMNFIADEAVIRGIFAVAGELILDASTKQIKIGGWENMLNGTQINEGIVQLKRNSALLNFVQAVLIIAMAAVLAGQGDVPPEVEAGES